MFHSLKESLNEIIDRSVLVEVEATITKIAQLINISKNSSINLRYLKEISGDNRINKEEYISLRRVRFEVEKSRLDEVLYILKKMRAKDVKVRIKRRGKTIVGIIRHSFFIVMCLIVVVLLRGKLAYITDIKVDGNKYIKDSQIVDTLRDNGITVGTKAKSVDTEKIENVFYVKYPNIKFITLNIEGTNLEIEIVDYKDD